MPAKHETDCPEWVFLAAVVLINLLAKGAFLGINTGEYTDGILQLTVFQTKAGLYPPLYGALSHAISLIGSSLETSGRVISLVAAALCVAPVYWLGMRLGGSTSARVAALLFTVSPMPWRWSVRVMTDSLYLLLGTICLVLLMEAWIATRRAHDTRNFHHGFGNDSDADELAATISHSRSIAAKCLASAVVIGALSVLTRYQGILFTPLIALVAILYIRRFKAVPWLALAAGLLWIALPVWMKINGFAHEDQFASRTGLTPLTTVMAWWNTFESFILIAPYYMGYPLIVLAIIGTLKARRTFAPGHSRLPALVSSGWLWGLYALMLLGLHAAFGSFQYRYMMPLIPIIAALAGVGFAWLEDRFPARRKILSALLLGSVVYLVIFSLAILVLQREAFGDQRQTAEFIKKELPPGVPVYSNERYGSFTKLGSVKLSYWSGRKVKSIISPDQPMEPGAVLALGTAYGGDENVSAFMQALSQNYELRALTDQPFRSQLTPLMDDIMTNPLYNQNPLGWVLRYVPQRFATQLFIVQPRNKPTAAANGS